MTFQFPHACIGCNSSVLLIFYSNIPSLFVKQFFSSNYPQNNLDSLFLSIFEYPVYWLTALQKNIFEIDVTFSYVFSCGWIWIWYPFSPTTSRFVCTWASYFHLTIENQKLTIRKQWTWAVIFVILSVLLDEESKDSHCLHPNLLDFSGSFYL